MLEQLFCDGFNTASGMDCMQLLLPHELPMLQPVSFQYRKRYGLHAMTKDRCMPRKVLRFNTASGMDCMQ